MAANYFYFLRLETFSNNFASNHSVTPIQNWHVSWSDLFCLFLCLFVRLFVCVGFVYVFDCLVVNAVVVVLKKPYQTKF